MKNQKPKVLDEFLDTLVAKWREVPGTRQERVFSSDMLNMPDDEFLSFWQQLYDDNCSGQGYSVRGWYHDLYTDLAARGGRWLEVGSGLGFDGTFFASKGAKVTFLDIVADNLKVVARVCKLKGIQNVEFFHLTSLGDVSRLGVFDCILAVGSLINAPFDMMCAERAALSSHLKKDGRWLELCYPRERWVREGSLPYERWGAMTDGDRTPWIEWYDLAKLVSSLSPHRFETVASFNFHNDDFNWFDLIKRG